MEAFDPKALYVDVTRERWEVAENVISLIDLILRWPYHAVINIPYELHWDIYDNKINEDNPPLALYLCDDVVTGQDEQKILRLRPIHINTPFSPFLTNLQNLVVLRHTVERLEAQHPNYAGQRPLKDGEHRLLLANSENITEVTLYILQAWKRALRHKQRIKSGDNLSSDFWLKIQDDIGNDIPLASELKEPIFTVAVQKPSLITPVLADTAEPSPQNPSHANSKKTKEEAKEFLTTFALDTNAQRLLALEAFFDAGYPRFKNEDLGELFWPTRHYVEGKTLKSYASKLCSRLKKIKGKTW